MIAAFAMTGVARGGNSNFANTMISTLPGDKAARGYNLLHGCFAVGALLSPLALVFLSNRWPETGWRLMAGVLAALCLVQLAVYGKMPLPAEPAKRSVRTVDRSFLRVRQFWLGSAMLFFSCTPAMVLVGLMGTGLFMATIYPSAFAFGSDCIRGNDFGCSVMILTGSAGGVITPALVGFAAERAGIRAGEALEGFPGLTAAEDVHRGHKLALTHIGKDQPVVKYGCAAVRNELWIVPTVGCVNAVAKQLVEANQHLVTGSIDGLYTFPHPFGCSQLGTTTPRPASSWPPWSATPTPAAFLCWALGARI